MGYRKGVGGYRKGGRVRAIERGVGAIERGKSEGY